MIMTDKGRIWPNLRWKTYNHS